MVQEMTNKRVQNDACIDSAESTGIAPTGENIPNVTFDELVVEVVKSLEDMHNELRRQRNKYGARYNHKNKYEQLNRRFGEDPLKLIDEYNLILDKKSNQPAAVREPIEAIVATAINRLIAAKMKAATKREQSSSLELPSESRFGEAKEAEEADKFKKSVK